MATKVSHNQDSWLIAGHTSSMSSPHMDCSGLCTWLNVVHGRKLWIIGHGLNKNDNLDETLAHAIDSIDGDLSMSSFDWVGFDARAGDDVYVYKFFVVTVANIEIEDI